MHAFSSTAVCVDVNPVPHCHSPISGVPLSVCLPACLPIRDQVSVAESWREGERNQRVPIIVTGECGPALGRSVRVDHDLHTNTCMHTCPHATHTPLFSDQTCDVLFNF